MKRNSLIKVRTIICGLLVMAAGVLLFAFNAGVLAPEYKYVVFSWQMLLIAIGVVHLFSSDKTFFGIILMLVGGIFLLPKLSFEGTEIITNNVWAIVLFVVGVFVISRALWKRPSFCHIHSSWETKTRKFDNPSNWKTKGDNSDEIDFNCVFIGGKKKVVSKNFRGGEINNVFGGMELDLTESQLAEGENHLEINSVFGGVVIYVPVDWNIKMSGTTQVFGAFVDNRPKTGFEVDEKRVLIIEAHAVFGGGEIKCK